MTQNFKDTIFLYNKKDELITYVELSGQNEIKSYYKLENRVLTRKNVIKTKERNTVFSDVKKAKIIFSEDCKLFHTFMEGESYCKVIKTGNTNLIPPEVLSRIYSHNDSLLEGCTINSGLIRDWSEKL